MFTKTKLSAVLFITSVAFSVSALATEVSIEQLTGSMLSQTVAFTQQELNNNLQGDLLSAVNNFSLTDDEFYATNVTITDLASDIQTEVKQQAE